MAGLRKKMESKEEDLREMRLTLRSKQEELQEMALRKDLAEKKLANLTRDHELTVETLKVFFFNFNFVKKNPFYCNLFLISSL